MPRLTTVDVKESTGYLVPQGQPRQPLPLFSLKPFLMELQRMLYARSLQLLLQNVLREPH